MTAPVILLDATGWRCPKPVIELARLVGRPPDGLADGALVTVRHSDPAAPGDIAAWCRMRGHELASSQAEASVVRVRRTPGAGAAAAPPPAAGGTPAG